MKLIEIDAPVEHSDRTRPLREVPVIGVVQCRPDEVPDLSKGSNNTQPRSSVREPDDQTPNKSQRLTRMGPVGGDSASGDSTSPRTAAQPAEKKREGE